MNDAPQVSVIVPAYDEAESIGQVLTDLNAALSAGDLTYEIIVVDDGSTDQTPGIARASGARLLQHGVNRGYGAALKTGIRAARGDRIVITDSDGTYPADCIPKLATLLDEWDMVIGARTGRNVHMPLIRRPAKWALNQLANYLTGTQIPDLNSGLRAFWRETALRFFPILPNGFSLTTTITLAMLSENCRVHFMPIDYHERRGRSKIHPIYDTLNFLQLIVRTVLYFNPLKVFLPLSLLFVVAGVLVGLISKLVFGKLLDTTMIVLIVTGVQILMLGMLADLIDKRSRI
jgi:glycosyltransferase involved in cell wall biosynthesis